MRIHALHVLWPTVPYCVKEEELLGGDTQFKKPYRTSEVFVFSKMVLRLSRGLNSWQLKKMNLIFLYLAVINFLYIWILLNFFPRWPYLFSFPVGPILRWNWGMGKWTERGCTQMCVSLKYGFRCSENVATLQCFVNRENNRSVAAFGQRLERLTY